MNVFDTIMKAATYIEGHPEAFHFCHAWIPNECGSPGCALGWIGFFGGLRGTRPFYDAAHELLGLSGTEQRPIADSVFYDRMDSLVGTVTWRYSAALCAKGLRLYAAKYHAPTQRTDSELVADLMARIGKQTIPDGEIASQEYARA